MCVGMLDGITASFEWRQTRSCAGWHTDSNPCGSFCLYCWDSNPSVWLSHHTLMWWDIQEAYPIKDVRLHQYCGSMCSMLRLNSSPHTSTSHCSCDSLQSFRVHAAVGSTLNVSAAEGTQTEREASPACMHSSICKVQITITRRKKKGIKDVSCSSKMLSGHLKKKNQINYWIYD